MNKLLGKLEKIDLQSYWTHEAHDFTPWLALPENLQELGNAIGLDLELEAQEKSVGSFNADLLCKTANDRWVVIENQLHPTDHKHLGQLLTYAAGLNAESVIWVAEKFTSEHRAALDWLNRITDEDFAFFAVEVELWRIGNSDPAPKFNVVCRPNEWARDVITGIKEEPLTDAKQTRLEFWRAFKSYLESHSKIRCQKPTPYHWMNHSLGRLGVHLASIASMYDNETGKYEGGELRVELVLDNKNAKSYFLQLEAQRAAIDREIGEPTTWSNPSDRNMCRIYVRRAADLSQKSQWPEFYEWLCKHLETFQKVFGPRVKSLVSKDTPEEESPE